MKVQSPGSEICQKQDPHHCITMFHVSIWQISLLERYTCWIFSSSNHRCTQGYIFKYWDGPDIRLDEVSLANFVVSGKIRFDNLPMRTFSNKLQDKG